MEEDESKEELSELLGLRVSVEELLVIDWIDEVRVVYVSPESFGRFIRHLYTVLEDRNGERGGRVRSEPKTEVSVGELWIRG